MDTEYIKNQVRDIVDFPTKGVVFKDLTTVLKNAEALKMISDELYDRYKNSGITKVVGIESRGFILASIVAYKLNADLSLSANRANFLLSRGAKATTRNTEATR